MRTVLEAILGTQTSAFSVSACQGIRKKSSLHVPETLNYISTQVSQNTNQTQMEDKAFSYLYNM